MTHSLKVFVDIVEHNLSWRQNKYQSMCF